MANAGPVKLIDAIQGASYPSIRSAVAILQNRKLNLAQFEIQLLADGIAKAVIFTDKNQQPGSLKYLGVRQGAAMEMNLAELAKFVGEQSQAKVIDTLQGANYPLVDSAAGVLPSHKLDVVNFRIEVVRDGDAVVVIFTHNDRAPAARGHIPATPAFEVQLNARDSTVVRANFVR